MEEQTFGQLLASKIGNDRRSRSAIAQASAARGGIGSDVHIMMMERGERQPPPVDSLLVLLDVLHVNRLPYILAALRQRQVGELYLPGPPVPARKLELLAHLVDRWETMSEEDCVRLMKALGGK